MSYLYAKTIQKYPEFKCPYCKIKCNRHCWNYNCLAEIGKDIEWRYDAIADKSYLAEIGTQIKHKCIEGVYIKNGEFAQDVDKVDVKTKAEMVRKWKAKVGYQRLTKQELEQVERGRKAYEGMKISKKK